MHRFKYIDSLRGIAIILVIFHHSHPYFAGIENYRLPAFFESFLQNGDKGVILFFLMSAFTLCLSLSKKINTEQYPIRNYFLRRAFRIVPLYYFMIILILLTRISNPTNYSLLANFLFLHGLSPYWVNSTIPGGWSVGIEVLFYLIFPLLFFWIKSVWSAVNLILICMLFAKLITSIMSVHPLVNDQLLWGIFTYENIISQLPVFLIGICLYRISTNKNSFEEQPWKYKTYCFIAVIIFLHLLGGNVFKEHYLFAIAFAFLSFGLSNYPFILLVNRFTVWVGKLSYSIYLVHLLVAGLLVKYHLNHYSSNASIEVVIRFSIILSISIAVSMFTYHLIEVPFQNLGKRVIEKLELKAISTSDAAI
ncbi:acyltransferase family protein [Mucilaginibacter sp. McL0603]|uniref:acyltransferase family protein n=1 Tax=Mucilaginibacter sp. McL0603 TaxID=3415670 RepID=UPI003CF09FAD